MKIGVIFPHADIGGDRDAVRSFAQGVEALGYQHIVVYDHVLGADPSVHVGWDGPYDIDTRYDEPMVLCGFLAAVTALELATGVIILPQRQTALVAKQAVEVDLLTGGNFRLGVGLGWNAVEYEAMGMDFSTRGKRIEEQVELLRAFWTQRSVTHGGATEKVTGAGLFPMPIQQPIPIWMGGGVPTAFERIGRLADGWYPMLLPGPELDEARSIIGRAALDAGRDPAAIGMNGQVGWRRGKLDRLVERATRWRDIGSSHLSVTTLGAGLTGTDGHLAALEETAEALGLGE